MYKITNKSFMSLQLLLDKETVYLGPYNHKNILYLENLTEQIRNLRLEGIVDIKKIK